MRKSFVPIQRNQAFVEPRRSRRIVRLGLEVFLGVGLELLRRYTQAWTASLKQDIQSRREISNVSTSSRSTQRKKPATDMATGKKRPFRAQVVELLKRTAVEWNRDKCPQLGAALAYYAVFSLAPLMLVLLGLFGMIYGGNEQAREKILEQLSYLIDPSALQAVQEVAARAAQPKPGLWAAILGVLVALFGASGVFGQLQGALNDIWDVKPKPKAGVWGFIRSRFLSFAMVGGTCFLLLVSLSIEGMLKSLHAFLQNMMPGGHYIGLSIFYVFDLAIIVFLFAMIFRFLPDAKVAWNDVWHGAVLTAIFFVIGKFLLGLYLSSGAAGSAYGAAGSLVTLLLWVFYSAQILLFGAEFTRIYANTCGSQIQPDEYAVKVKKTEVEIPNIR